MKYLNNINVISLILFFLFALPIFLPAVFYPFSFLWISNFLNIILSVLILYKATGTFRIITAPYLYLIYFLLLIYIGSMRTFSLNGNYTMFWGLNGGILAFSCGVFCASFFSLFSPKKEYHIFSKKPVIDNMQGKHFRLVFLVFCGIALIFTLYYLYKGFQKVGVFPLLSFIGGTGSTGSRMTLRYAFSHVAGSGYLQQFSGNLLPFLFLIALAKYLHHKSNTWKAVSICLFIPIVFTFLVSGSRAPILIFLTMIFILFNLYYGKIELRLVVKFVSLGLLVLLILTLFKFGIGSEESFVATILNAFQATTRRILVIQAIPIDFIFNYFPDPFSFKYGTTWINDLKGLLPGEQIGFATHVADLRSALFGTRSHSNPIGIFGEFYVNFGLTGVIIGMFITGFLLQKAHIYLIRSQKTVINLAFYATLTQALAYLSLASLISGLFQFGILMFVFTVISIKVFFSIGKTIR